MRKCRVGIIVPVYKTQLNDLEKISFAQLINILGKYEICAIAPNGLELPVEFSNQNVKVQYFQKKYFQSVESYNLLMLSAAFYERFLKYEYILLYQLDAFVFEDRLEYFCRLGYDYIGAPWLRGVLGKGIYGYRICWAGNGGLSLRRVNAAYRLLKEHDTIVSQYEGNEDVFFSASGGKDFKVASLDTALEFSFEMQVKDCFRRNNRKLPFGCHAWHRFDMEFWKPLIEACHYKIPRTFLKEGKIDSLCHADYMRENAFSNFYCDERLHDKFKRAVLEKFDKKRAVCIWGAGFQGVRMLVLFEKVGIKVRNLIDSNPQKQGSSVAGHDICTIQILENSDFNIVVAVRNGTESIMGILEKLGYYRGRNLLLLEDIEKLIVAD